MRIALTALTPKGPADVIVSGDDGATAGQVAEALQEAFAPREHLASVIMHPRAAAAGTALPVSGPALWAGGQQIPPDKPVARALRDGTVVTTIERAAAATSLAEPGGVAEVRVIGGPDAGTVHRLGAGLSGAAAHAGGAGARGDDHRGLGPERAVARASRGAGPAGARRPSGHRDVYLAVRRSGADSHDGAAADAPRDA